MKNKNAIMFLGIMYSIGIAGHLIPSVRPLMILLTPFTLLLTGGLVAYKSFFNADKKFIYWGIITYAITFLLEVIGVKTGLVFGDYQYGTSLGLQILDVPLIIGFNWVLVILGAISISKYFSKNILVTALIASILSVIFDFFLEPVAIQLNYWDWAFEFVPIQNYLAWIIIAFSFSVALLITNPDFNKGITKEYFIIQLVFFLVLNLFMR